MATSQPSISLLPTGTFTDKDGKKVRFTGADLADVASSYAPATDPAPLVIGHPDLNAPAYGWVSRLNVENERLVANVGQLDASFAEAVRQGRYSRVSASLYEPSSPANPKPGHWYLRHVGFLGAAAPAIKGLGTVAFGERGSAGVVALAGTVSFAAPADRQRSAFNGADGRVVYCFTDDLSRRANAIMASDGVSFADALEIAKGEFDLADMPSNHPQRAAIELLYAARRRMARSNTVMTVAEAVLQASQP